MRYVISSNSPAQTEPPLTSAFAAKPWDVYSEPRRWALLFVLFLVTTSSYVDRNIIGVLLQPIKEEFHVSDTMLGLLSGLSFAMFYATLGMVVPISGELILTVGLGVTVIVAVFIVWRQLASRSPTTSGPMGAVTGDTPPAA